MAHLEGHNLVFPYGAIPLIGQGRNRSVFRLVELLMRHAGHVVKYEDIAAEMWPDTPPDPRMRHVMHVVVARLNDAARDLGMVALITVASDIGYAWSATEDVVTDTGGNHGPSIHYGQSKRRTDRTDTPPSRTLHPSHT
jgi:DNA-binding winged helix-turn-helix (wHTH) protein